MPRVIWSTNALETFEAALVYIAEENPQNAARVSGRILKTASLLESFSLGLPAPKGYSKLYVPKTPYFLVFTRDENDNVNILSLIHASRDWEQIDWEKI